MIYLKRVCQVKVITVWAAWGNSTFISEEIIKRGRCAFYGLRIYIFFLGGTPFTKVLIVFFNLNGYIDEYRSWKMIKPRTNTWKGPTRDLTLSIYFLTSFRKDCDPHLTNGGARSLASQLLRNSAKTLPFFWHVTTGIIWWWCGGLAFFLLCHYSTLLHILQHYSKAM